MKKKENIWWVGKRAYRNLGRKFPWSSRSKNIANRSSKRKQEHNKVVIAYRKNTMGN
jgi:hypothetical protein